MTIILIINALHMQLILSLTPTYQGILGIHGSYLHYSRMMSDYS